MGNIELEEKARKVMNGEDFTKFSRREILDLQEYALDTKDLDLYDKLEKYWDLKNFQQ